MNKRILERMGNLCFDLMSMGLISPHESIYHQRCRDIQEQLKEYDVKANVIRHTFNNTKYYVLEVDLNSNNAEMTVSKALNIKEKEVHFIHINLKGDYKLLWVSEDLLHALYLDGDGRLNFDIEKYKDEALNYLNNSEYYVKSININSPDTVDLVLKKKNKIMDVFFE